MPFFEFLIVATVFVGLPAVIFDGIAKLKRADAKAKEGGAMRKSELEALIRVAVEDATEPLHRRIETLEAIATSDEPQGGRIDAAVLSEALGVPGAAPDRSGQPRTPVAS